MKLLEPGHPKKYISNQLLWFVCWLAVTGVGAWLTPSVDGHGTHQKLGLPPCPSVLLFNRPCPGCGMTTSWSAFIHGNFGLSFHAHPLGPFTYLLFTAVAWLGLYGFAKNTRVKTELRSFSWTLSAAAAVFVAFGFIRMAVTPNFGTKTEQVLASVLKQK